jgi:O-antigen ligase
MAGAIHSRGGGTLERASEILLLLLALVLIFSIAAAQTVAVLLIAAVALRLALGHGRPYRRTPLDVPLAVFLLARILSIATSVDPARSVASLHTELVFYLLIPAVTNTLGTDPSGKIRRVLRVAALAGAAAAAIGIFSVLMGWEVRAASTTGGYYTLGIYLAALLPILLLLGGTQGFFPRLPVWGGLAAVVGIGIVATYNRLHWLAAGGSLILAGLLRERRILLVALPLALVLFFAFPGLTERIQQAIDPSSRLSGRDVLWRGAAMIAADRPVLGFGPRTFPVVFPLFEEMSDRNVGSWHNDYLQVYMESGLLGLGSLLWLLWRGVAPAIKLMRLQAEGAERSLLLALLSSLAFFVIFGGMFDTLIGLFFKLLLGATAVLVSSATPPAAPPVATEGGRG